MSKISMMAKLTAADGKADELATALTLLIAAAEEEAGLEVYSVHRVDEEPDVFWFFELYRDEPSLAAHGRGEAMKAAMGAVGACLGARPEIIRLTPVAAKGLEV